MPHERDAHCRRAAPRLQTSAGLPLINEVCAVMSSTNNEYLPEYIQWEHWPSRNCKEKNLKGMIQHVIHTSSHDVVTECVAVDWFSRVPPYFPLICPKCSYFLENVFSGHAGGVIEGFLPSCHGQQLRAPQHWHPVLCIRNLGTLPVER